LAEQSIAHCPDVQILATSREALDIAGEISFLVPSLSAPDLFHPIHVDTLTRYECVRLFVDRAADGIAGFAVTKTTLQQSRRSVTS
jgi:non-specific serine/threonine protein kinase